MRLQVPLHVFREHLQMPRNRTPFKCQARGFILDEELLQNIDEYAYAWVHMYVT